MLFVWSILITIPQLLLLLNSLFEQLCGIGDGPGNSNISPRVGKLSNPWSNTTEKPFFKNLNEYNRNKFLMDLLEQRSNVINITDVMPATESCCENHEQHRYRQDNTKVTIYHEVTGGSEATPEQFPHVVALGKENEVKKFSLLCGGSLIARSSVLTAAHCTHGAAGVVTIARLGIQRLSDSGGDTVSIKRSIRHPSYNPPAMYADIALLELQRPVTFSSTIRPAILHTDEYDLLSTDGYVRFGSIWVCGWGAKEFGGIASDTLQAAEVQIVNNVHCAIRHRHSICAPDGIAPSMVCAGAPLNNWRQDTCYGDSGGPLQIMLLPYASIYMIIGITSFGDGCGFVNSPGVYTRVSHYFDWIKDYVWPDGR